MNQKTLPAIVSTLLTTNV